MEEHHSKPKRKFQLPAQIAPLGFLWKQLTRDREAFRILIACTLAMVTTGLEPAFLTLSTPEIQNRLRAPDTHAPMFIGLGFLIFAVLTLVAGTTGDLFGRKRVMVIGLAVLTLANALGGLAFGTPLFVLADVLATIAVLAVLPMCIATMTLIYPLEVRPLAYGLLFGSLFTAIIAGASLGGLFDALGYPAVSFLPVVVVGVYALRQVTRHVPESRAPKEFRRANAVVNLLLLAGVFVLVFLVIVARSYLESWLPVLVAALALLLLVLGVRWLRGRVRFFKGVEMFTGRDTGFAIVAGIVLFIAEGAFLYQFTAFFQNVWDMGAALAGISFIPFLIGLLPGTFLVARLALRFGARRIIAGGLVIMGASLVWLSFTRPESSYWFLLVPMILLGFGFGLAIPARTQVVLSAPPVDLTGSAAAINTASGQLGYALGVVISSMLVTQLADTAFLGRLVSAGLPETTLGQIKQTLPGVLQRTVSGEYPKVPQAVLDLASARYDQAFTTGMGQMFLILAVLMFLAAGAIYLGMHRGLRAAGAPPLMSMGQPSDTQAPADRETEK